MHSKFQKAAKAAVKIDKPLTPIWPVGKVTALLKNPRRSFMSDPPLLVSNSVWPGPLSGIGGFWNKKRVSREKNGNTL
jgi:hypothetical protein